MSDKQDFQFHRERKKREKIEDMQVWVKGMSLGDKSSWAFAFTDGKKDLTFISGKSDEVDINRLYLISIVEFFEWISEDKRLITIHTDNNYIINVLQEWIDKWKYSQFQLPDGSSRPNGDLLVKICLLKTPHILNTKQLFTSDDFSLKLEDLCRNELNQQIS